MGTTTDYPLSITIRAIDKATAPLRAMNQRLRESTAPVRQLGASLSSLSGEVGITKLASSFQDVAGRVAGLGLKMLGLEAISVGALYHIVRGSVDAGEELFHAAKRAGMTVDAYAQLRFAAEQAGVEQEQFASAIDQFNKRLGDAKAGGGPLLEFLQKVSPVLATQVASAKSSEEALGLLTKAFEKVKDPAKLAALSAAAFGKGSVEMGQFLHEGTEEIEKQSRLYRMFAGSKEVSTLAASELAKAFGRMNTAAGGLRGALVSGLYPGVLAITNALTMFMAEHRESLAGWARSTSTAISKWVAEGGMEKLTKALGEISSAAGWVVDKLGGVGNAALIAAGALGIQLAASVGGATKELVLLVVQLARTAYGLAALAFGPVVAAIGDFIVAIRAGYGVMAAFNLILTANPIGAIITGITLLAGAAYLIYKNWAPIKKFFEDLWDTLKQVFSSPIASIQKAWNWVTGGSSSSSDSTGVQAARPTIGANAAAPQAASARPPAQQAHVTVDFNNLPPGARVSQDPSGTAALDLGLGYSMVTP